MSPRLRAIAFTTLLTGFAAPAAAAPAMFQASFIFHAWGNDASGGTGTPYISNDWTAVPLGYDCQSAEQYTTNGGPSSRWCSQPKMQRGHPATGSGTLSEKAGAPLGFTLPQSAFGVTTSGTLGTFPPYLQTITYATFVNAAGSFFAGGGAAAANGYNNKTPMTGMDLGSWRIRAGVNGFGGAMGLLGKYGASGKYTVPGVTGTFHGTSSWPMVKAVGRPLPSGTLNPFSKTDKWYKTTPKGGIETSTINAIGTGTLWTTGQVGNIALVGEYYTELWRTGYDNRTPGGLGTIQLVTPTLTHWLAPAWSTHSAQVGLLKIHVPEPGAVLLLAAGIGALLMLRRVGRRR